MNGQLGFSIFFQTFAANQTKLRSLRRTAHTLTLFTVALLHLIFLMAILWDQEVPGWLIPGLVIILIPLGLIILRSQASEELILKKRDLLYILSCTGGALANYWINIEFELGAVLAAGIVGLVAGLIPKLNSDSPILKSIPVAVYCGAFVGMTAEHVADGYIFILTAGIITGIILMLAKNSLNGYGGKLGTLAFGGVCVVYLLMYLGSII